MALQQLVVLSQVLHEQLVAGLEQLVVDEQVDGAAAPPQARGPRRVEQGRASLLQPGEGPRLRCAVPCRAERGSCRSDGEEVVSWGSLRQLICLSNVRLYVCTIDYLDGVLKKWFRSLNMASSSPMRSHSDWNDSLVVRQATRKLMAKTPHSVLWNWRRVVFQ